MRLKDLTGQKFHLLTVIKRAGANRQGSSTWLCKCDCGNEITASSDHLTRKKDPIKGCGCKRYMKGNEKPQWNGAGEISGGWWYNRVSRERDQKRRTKVPATVTIEFAWDLFLKQNRKCALSGVDLVISTTHHYNTASIDRIDSSKGYEEDNIQWVHKHINFMKRTYSQEYFIEMCKKVAENNKE